MKKGRVRIHVTQILPSISKIMKRKGKFDELQLEAAVDMIILELR